MPSPYFVNSQPSKPHLHGVRHGPIAANLNSLNRTLGIWDWHIQGKNKRSKSHPPLLKLATRIFSIRFWVAIMVKPIPIPIVINVSRNKFTSVAPQHRSHHFTMSWHHEIAPCLGSQQRHRGTCGWFDVIFWSTWSNPPFSDTIWSISSSPWFWVHLPLKSWGIMLVFLAFTNSKPSAILKMSRSQ